MTFSEIEIVIEKRKTIARKIIIITVQKQMARKRTTRSHINECNQIVH